MRLPALRFRQFATTCLTSACLVSISVQPSWSMDFSLSNLNPLKWKSGVSKEASDSTEQPVDDQQVNNLHVGEGLFQYYRDQHTESLIYLLSQQALGQVPAENLHANILISAAYLKNGLTDAALPPLEKLIDSQTLTEKSVIYFHLGQQYLFAHRYTDAIEMFQRVDLEQLPETSHQTYFYLLADAHRRNGALTEAEQQANQLNKQNVQFALLQYNLAYHYLDKEQPEKSLQRLDELLQQKTAHPAWPPLRDRVYLLKGYIHLSMEQPEQATRSYQAIDMDSPWLSDATLHLAWSALQSGQPAVGLSAIQHASSQTLPDPLSWADSTLQLQLLYGQLAEAGGSPELATAQFEQARSNMKQLKQQLRSFNRDSIQHILKEHALSDRPADVSGTQLPAFMGAPLSQKGLSKQLTQLKRLQVQLNHLEAWEEKFSLFELVIAAKQEARQHALALLPSETIAAKLADQTARYHALRGAYEVVNDKQNGFALLNADDHQRYQQFREAEKRMVQLKFSGPSKIPEGLNPISPSDLKAYDARLQRIGQRLLWESNAAFHVNRWRVYQEMQALKEAMLTTQHQFDSLTQAVEQSTYLVRSSANIQVQRDRLNQLKARNNALSNQVMNNLVDHLLEEKAAFSQQIQYYLSYIDRSLASLYDESHQRQKEGQR